MSDGVSTVSTRALPRALPFFAWTSFVLNVVIIATGGAVRLTGSGLGCSEWPFCTPDSLVPTPEMGIHGIIEFGNRTISGPLLIAAIVVVYLSFKIQQTFVLSLVVFGLVALQAIVGGLVVWEDLKASLVGFHYTVSVVIVCIAAAYLVRMAEPSGPRERAVPLPFLIVTHVTSLALAMTVFVGVLTTGAGPHSGDENVIRDGFDATLLAHIHSWPGYVLAVLLLALLVWAAVARLRPLRWLIVTTIVVIVQIAVGIYQARSGLPPLAVGVHMVLAALTSAAFVVVVLRLKRPVE